MNNEIKKKNLFIFAPNIKPPISFIRLLKAKSIPKTKRITLGK